MLGKLLKYDMAAVFRYWWIAAVTTLAFSGATALAFSSAASGELYYDNEGLFLFLGFSALGWITALTAAGIVTQILIYVRFYKNFYTDEGYLTFTLPVSRRMLYLSKTLNAFIWNAIQSVLTVVCVACPVLWMPINADHAPRNLWQAFVNSLSELWNGIGVWLVVYIFIILLFAACCIWLSVNFIQFCITLGAVIAKKHKIIASVGVYYATTMVISFVRRVFRANVMPDVMMGVYTSFERIGADAKPAVIMLYGLVVLFFTAALAWLVYCVTQYIIDRRIELA